MRLFHLWLVFVCGILFAGCGKRFVLPPTFPGVGGSQVGPIPKPPPPEAEAAWVPEAYQVEIVISGLTYPTSVEFDDEGNMYVAEAGWVYGDTAAPARVFKVSGEGELTLISDRFHGPITDLLWHEGQLYVSHRTKVSLIRNGAVLDLVTGLPSLGDHQNNQLSVGPDGKMYVGQGTMTNSGVVGVDNFAYGWLRIHPDLSDQLPYNVEVVGREFLTMNPFWLGHKTDVQIVGTGPFQPFGKEAPEDGIVRAVTKANGTILRFNPEDGSGLEVYAWGLRNPFGVLWGTEERLFVTENGFDDRGSRPVANAPDNVWLIREGVWYGWPDYASGVPVTAPRFKPVTGPSPEFILRDHPRVELPLAALPPHVAVAKLDMSRNDRFGPAGALWIAETGDMRPFTGALNGGARHAGFQVIVMDPRTGKWETFFRAKPEALGHPPFEYVNTPGPKRPVDVRFSPGGHSLYVVDIGVLAVLPTAMPTLEPMEMTGVIWRITPRGEQAEGPPAELVLPFTAQR